MSGIVLDHVGSLTCVCLARDRGTADLGLQGGSVAYGKTAWRIDTREYPRRSAAPMCPAVIGLGAS